MSDGTNIEWTDATWNPIIGCSLVSPGCTNCYAMRAAARPAGNPATPHYAGTVTTVNGKPVWTGAIGVASEATWTKPMRWREPRRVFVNSMGDLFHESIPDELIDRAFAVMSVCPQHTFQVLTKRAERMRDYIDKPCWPREEYIQAQDRWWLEEDTELARLARRAITPHFERWEHDYLTRWPLRHVWLGVSVEDQRRADERIPLLLQTPAAVRFVSCEPLLGPIDLNAKSRTLGARPGEITEDDDTYGPPLGGINGIDWVIVGGESGPDARPMHPDWARAIRDQCAAAGVPFFFKQWGQFGPAPCPPHVTRIGKDDVLGLGRVGKKAAGRMLDGRTHDEDPRQERR